MGNKARMSKGRLFLFHWNKPDAEAYAQVLENQGWEVDYEWEDGARGSKKVKESPPDVMVFYLTRLPSHSRTVAEYLVQAKSTRNIPFIFVEGEGDALVKTRKKIPNGIFISEEQLASTLARFAKS